MFHWIIYDISNDRKRLRISEKCKDYGLKRVQKSAFVGNVSKNKLDMLAIELKDVMKENEEKNSKGNNKNDTNKKSKNNEDAVFIFPSCKTCFSEKRIEGRFDEEAIRKKDFFFIGD